jgi:hypothetical protein
MKTTKTPATNIKLIRAENCLCRILEALIFEFFTCFSPDKTLNKKAGLEQTNVYRICFVHYAVQVNFTVLISILSLRKILNNLMSTATEKF